MKVLTPGSLERNHHRELAVPEAIELISKSKARYAGKEIGVERGGLMIGSGEKEKDKERVKEEVRGGK